MNESSRSASAHDVVDILMNDHREMLELVSSIEHEQDPASRRDLADALIAEVMRHAVAEEMHVYPAVEAHVPNGAAQVAHDKQEHQEIVELMKQVEDIDATNPAFIQRVRQLEGALRHHAADEETEQFPQLRAHISGATLIELASKVEAAKKLAPTRPHPSAPHAALFHKTIGPGVGMIDRLRDALTGRHTG